MRKWRCRNPSSKDANVVFRAPPDVSVRYAAAGALGLVCWAMALCTSEDDVYKGHAVYLLVATGLFHSVMWPTIFTLAIDGLGNHTSSGSGLLMMGVFGGAVIPFCQGA